jgi:hypothetical protein
VAIGFVEVENGIQTPVDCQVLAWAAAFFITAEDNTPSVIGIGITVNGVLAESPENNPTTGSYGGEYLVMDGSIQVSLNAGDILGVRFFADQPTQVSWTQLIVGEMVLEDNSEGGWAIVQASSVTNDGPYLLTANKLPGIPVPFNQNAAGANQALLGSYNGWPLWYYGSELWSSISSAIQETNGESSQVVLGDGTIGAVPGLGIGIGDYIGLYADTATITTGTGIQLNFDGTTIVSGSSLTWSDDPQYITVAETGVYAITLTVDWQDSGAPGVRAASIWTTCQFEVTDQRAGAGDSLTDSIQSLSTTLYLQADDSISINLTQGSGSTLTPYVTLLATRCA